MAMTLADPAARPGLLIVQTGDFGAAWARMAAGAPETYRDQYASLRFVAGLARDFDITTLAICARPHDELLIPGLRAIGVSRAKLNPRRIAALMDRLTPARLIMRSPFIPILAEARRRRIPTLPCFADIFAAGRFRGRWRIWRLRRLLKGPHIPGVANHSLNASRSAVAVLGLPPGRVIPWDWSRIRPETAAKTGMADPTRPRCFYAGALSEAKGLGDCLEALAILHGQGLRAQLSVAGGGDPQPWTARIAALGLKDVVDLLGVVPNSQVRADMAAHDLVIVPSRAEYPEGLPNTIYEGLASRSPVILSDHPAFRGRIRNGAGGLVFRAGDPAALAGAIRQLSNDPALYEKLSAGAETALADLHVGLEWPDLVRHFLDDPHNETGWVNRSSLASLKSVAF
jgi:Glycosyltransferase